MKYRMPFEKDLNLREKIYYTIEMEGTTIPHEVLVEWDGAKILLKPAPAGTGVVAGSKVRSVLELGGVKDVIAKNLGSNNPLNQVKATFKALGNLKNREKTLAERKGAKLMYNLSQLKNTSRPKKKVQRIGRGIGSKRGATSGRGGKGDSARQGYRKRFGYEGGQVPLYRKLPIRGFTRGRFVKPSKAIGSGLIGSLLIRWGNSQCSDSCAKKD